MNPYFLDAARAELDDAIDNYDEQHFGLGSEFEDEVQQAVGRIEHYPEAWSPLSKRVRRCIVNRFPYSVIYEIRTEIIIIVAIQHHRKEPESWRSRLNE